MKNHAEMAFLLAQDRQGREREEARQHRLVAGSRSPRHVRRAVGRSLVRLGQRLVDAEAAFEPARQR